VRRVGARRLLERAAPTAAPAFEGDPRVRVVRVEGRELIDAPASAPARAAPGALVWVRPDAETTAEEMAAAVERWRGSGAARVVPTPVAAGDRAVPAAAVERPVRAAAKVREVVEEMLAELGERHEEVRAVVDRALAEEGI